MLKEIVINKDYTSIVSSDNSPDTPFEPIKREKIITTASFGNNLSSQFTGSEILPIGTRYYKNDLGSKIILIEQPPGLRTVKVSYDLSYLYESLESRGLIKELGLEKFNFAKETHDLRLSFPFIVFLIKLNSDNQMEYTKIFFRLQPVSSLNDYLFIIPLMNVSGSQDICLGESLKGEKNDTVNDGVMSVLNKFWFNKFNSDYLDNVRLYEKAKEWGVTDVLSWSYYTKRDPMFIYKVKWIQYKKTLGEEIDIMNKLDESGGIFNNVFRAVTFQKPGQKRKDGILEVPLRTKSISIDGYTITIGDIFKFNRKEYIVVSFMGLGNSNSRPSTIIFEDSEGNELVKKITASEKKSLQKQIEDAETVESIEVNGEVINTDDILNVNFKLGKKYKAVKKIRIAIDGKSEVQFNDGDFYFIENIKYDKVVIEDIKIGDTKIEKDKTYVIINKDDQGGFISVLGIFGKFEGFDIEKSEQISIKFSDSSTVPLGSDKYQVIEYEEKDENPNCIRIHHKLTTNHVDGEKAIIIKGKCIIRPYMSESNYSSEMAKIEVLDSLDKPTEVNIKSYDIDLNFKIGDHIIAATWKEPKYMIEPQTITGFDIKDDILHFIVKESGGSSHNVPYIDFNTGFVNICGIRKISTDEYGGITPGSKIRCKISGIIHFPKKDINTVVGFINDTGTNHPLMLCSNGLTLWAHPDMLSLFEVYKEGSKQWKSFINAPVCLDNAKYQSGDIFYWNDNPLALFIVGYQGDLKKMRLFQLNDGYGLGWSDTFDTDFINKNFTRIGILTPRYSLADYGSLVIKHGFPNLLGGLVQSNFGNFGIKEVWEHV